MPVDLNEQLTGQLVVIAQQGVADNQRISMQTNAGDNRATGHRIWPQALADTLPRKGDE